VQASSPPTSKNSQDKPRDDYTGVSHSFEMFFPYPEYVILAF
jgi:hypothetical protein